jgi:glycosyltransferase involved in cell wall biosynthesis
MIKIRFLPHVPYSIHCGGFEVSTKILYNSLKDANTVDVKYFNWCGECFDYDILHLYGGSPNWYDLAFHFPSSKKLVVTALGAQDPFGFNANLKSYFISKLNILTKNRTVHDRTNFVLNRADAIICLSDLEKLFFVKRYNISDSKLHVIPNSVPNDWQNNEFNYKEVLKKNIIPVNFIVKKYILFIGTISKRKNPLNLLRACKYLGLNIIIVGKGIEGELSYFNDLMCEIEKYKSNCIYVKEVPYGSLLHKSLIKGCSVFALPSEFETQPLVLLEALSLGSNILVGNGFYTKQKYFNNQVNCNPNSINSIVDGLLKSMVESDEILIENIIDHNSAVKMHIELYYKLLQHV